MKNEAQTSESLSPLDISETKHLAETLLDQLNSLSHNGALVIGLHGDLGAGKTTFMQFFGAALGVNEKMVSPTFVIEKIYKVSAKNFDHLIHIDAYRIEDVKEMRTLGWDNIVKDPRNIICVEWADRIASLLPPDTIRLEFSHHDENHRMITVKMPSGTE